MSKVRVQSFGVSIEGYGAGPNQDLQNPIGVGGTELMEWFFPTRVWRRMHGEEYGATGVDNEVAEQGFAGIGAWILGRNMRRRAGLVDEMHLVVRPVVLGSGEHLLNGIDLRALGYECAKSTAGERATHVFLRKRTPRA